jgi:hypothetical protein
MGSPANLRIVAVVLLVLAGEHGRIVSRQYHQPAFDANIRQGHEGVGRHIQPHMFHHAHGAQSCSWLTLRPLPGRPFHWCCIQSKDHSPERSGTGSAKFPMKGSRGRWRQSQTGFNSPPGNGLVAQHEHLLPRVVDKQFMHGPSFVVDVLMMRRPVDALHWQPAGSRSRCAGPVNVPDE